MLQENGKISKIVVDTARSGGYNARMASRPIKPEWKITPLRALRISDKDWAELTEAAKLAGVTASGLLRAAGKAAAKRIKAKHKKASER